MTSRDNKSRKQPTSGILSRVPESWIPYIKVARLSPPAGWFLIYFPHLFGILHAVRFESESTSKAVAIGLISFVESFFFSNAAHIWNDIVDADLDALVTRTRHRPIPSGAISPRAASIFAFTQLVATVVTYTWLPSDIIWFSLPYWIGSAYYPYAKRHTYWPQAVLGFCLAWGIVMGEVSMGYKPFHVDLTAFPYIYEIRGSTVSLFLADFLWTILYDTIYAHQDYTDDLKAGILSLAVLYKGKTKPLLWTILALMTAALISSGRLDNASPIFYATAVCGSVASLALMIYRVELSNTDSCWWWFKNGFWSAGGIIAAGLFLESVVDPHRY